MSGAPTQRVLEAAAAAIAMTTGLNLRRTRAIAMMMHGRSDAVLATIGKGRIKRRETATTIMVGPSAIATVVNAIERPETRSRATCTCRVGRSASWFATAIASTPCVAPNRERSQPLARSEWSRVVIFAGTMAARLIRAPAIFVICVNKG